MEESFTPHVVNLVEVDDEEHHHCYWFQKSWLVDKLPDGKLKPNNFKGKYMLQLFKALSYLHFQDINIDIKPGNRTLINTITLR